MEGLLRAWQMTLPGAPSVYYGDEAGLTGGKDPENRKPFPWGKEEPSLEGCCRSLIHLRRQHTALSTGRFQTFLPGEMCMCTVGSWKGAGMCSVSRAKTGSLLPP